MASCTQDTEKVCSWAYLLKNNQVRQFVTFNGVDGLRHVYKLFFGDDVAGLLVVLTEEMNWKHLFVKITSSSKL